MRADQHWKISCQLVERGASHSMIKPRQGSPTGLSAGPVPQRGAKTLVLRKVALKAGFGEGIYIEARFVAVQSASRICNTSDGCIRYASDSCIQWQADVSCGQGINSIVKMAVSPVPVSEERRGGCGFSRNPTHSCEVVYSCNLAKAFSSDVGRSRWHLHQPSGDTKQVWFGGP